VGSISDNISLHICMSLNVLKFSVISVLKFISVLVSIKFFLNHFSISFYIVFRIFSVAVSIQFPLYQFSLNSI
jgi:hypothetical protein